MIESDIHNEDCFDFSPIIPHNLMLKINIQLETCICKIFNNKGKVGTGFFCKLPYPNEFRLLPTLFTNNHVLDEDNLKEEKIKIKYKGTEKYLKLDESRKKFTDIALDVTIIEIRPDLDDINDFLDIDLRCLKENYNEIYKNDKKIYILQIPLGGEISFSYGEIVNIENQYICHKCSTKDGSSGSPILSQSNYQIIGLHKGFKKKINANIGILINFILDKFKSYYPINPELDDPSFIQQQIFIYDSIKKKPSKDSKKIKTKKSKKTINKNIKNIIEMELENNNNSRDIYFLDNSKNHDGLEELNKDNTEIYINNIKIEYQKHFEFSKGNFKIQIIIYGIITNCSNMFINCKNITSIDLSKFCTENVTNMKNMFKKCSNLTNINLQNLNTKNVKDMGHMFSSCENLSSLDISNFKTNNVNDMSYMFYNCRNLSKIDLSNFNTENVTNMENMFFSCENLNNIIFTSSFNTMKATKMNKMFKLCKNIKYLNLSFFNTKNVENMSEMFSICESLANLDLSISFNTKNVKDMSKMFNSCSSLKTLDLRFFNTQNVKNMSEMFKHCQNIENIIISSSFSTMNVENMKEMFFSCHKLNSLDLKYFNTLNVTNMNSMFANCDNLEILDLSSFSIKNTNDMESMFKDCYKLRILTISNFDIKNVSSYNNLFKDCKNLSDIYISKTIDDSLIRYQLNYCSIKANINKI